MKARLFSIEYDGAGKIRARHLIIEGEGAGDALGRVICQGIGDSLDGGAVIYDISPKSAQAPRRKRKTKAITKR